MVRQGPCRVCSRLALQIVPNVIEQQRWDGQLERVCVLHTLPGTWRTAGVEQYAVVSETQGSTGTDIVNGGIAKANSMQLAS